MLSVKITASVSHSQGILVKTDVLPYYITLLSSKSNHYVLHEKLFVIIRTCEFAV